MPNAIRHIFVLENRSFDHMLGFSGNTGADATTRAVDAHQLDFSTDLSVGAVARSLETASSARSPCRRDSICRPASASVLDLLPRISITDSRIALELTDRLRHVRRSGT